MKLSLHFSEIDPHQEHKILTSREIALVTFSGKAYYQLTSALKRKKISYYSLTPDEVIPRHVKVVITTETENRYVTHPNTFIYSNDDPNQFINTIIQQIRGKKEYTQVVIGVDPGHQFGLAILGDGILLKTRRLSSVKDIVADIQSLLMNISADQIIIKIGNGNPLLSIELKQRLHDQLDSAIDIEIVDEHGTTKNYRRFSSYNRTSKDIYSAIRIAHRRRTRTNT
jgi:hypothetical protein